MLQQEFEERYGKSVTPEEYSFIERTYMAAEGVDKDRFCKEWKEYHLSESHIVAELTHAVEREQVSRQQWQHTASMTDFDKKLIEKADKFRRFDYADIDVLISIADTEEARERLRQIALELYHATLETL